MKKVNKNQVLYLSYDGMTDPLGQSQVLPYLAGLSKEGYQISLISCEKKELYHKHKAIIQNICNNYQIDWHPLFYTRKPPILSTLFDLSKMYCKARSIYRKKHFGIIHCRSYITALVGLRFKRKKKIKFIFDMRGFWADERVDGEIWDMQQSIFKKVYNFFKKKEKQFLQEADKIISLTYAGREEMLKWNITELTKDKIEVIPCTADFDVFELNTIETKAQAKLNLGLRKDQFVLLYIGSLGTWYMLPEMLRFFKALKVHNPDAKFLFLTPHRKEEILNEAVALELKEEDFIIQFAQRVDISKYAHAADYGICFIKPKYSKIASSPTKLGEMLAMGIPIISNRDMGDTSYLIQQFKVGFIVDTFKRPDIFQQIREISKATFEAEQIRQSAEEYFSLKIGVNRYINVYKTLSID